MGKEKVNFYEYSFKSLGNDDNHRIVLLGTKYKCPGTILMVNYELKKEIPYAKIFSDDEFTYAFLEVVNHHCVTKNFFRNLHSGNGIPTYQWTAPHCKEIVTGEKAKRELLEMKILADILS